MIVMAAVIFVKNTFAQTIAADNQFIAASVLQQAFDDQGTGDDDISAFIR